ncbi:class II aldolase/adducin family protein [bacterium]|jgi:L-fuculose-phosphate aldolase|nr:class II aldolase/adducin family protein [bacterium]
MSPSFRQRKDLIGFCHLLYQRGYMVSSDGNLSVRLEDGFLTTPSGRNKGLIGPEDLVSVDENGNPRQLDSKPSSEFLMHQRVYQLRPEINAVVHCHPVYATALAASSVELDSCLLTESIVTVGSVPRAPLAIPSTQEIPQSIAPLVPHTDVLLLQNHGVLAYGKTLEEAYNRLETVEHYAKIQYLLHLAGIATPVRGEEVERLENLRKGYGLEGPYVPCNRESKSGTESEMEKIAATVARILKEKMR